MAAARYWRIVGVETYAGGDLELSELHLYGASGRLDAAATLTSTVAPIAGTLANLQDDDLATVCRFAGASVRAGGFALVWDFGAGNAAEAIGVRMGSGPSSDRHAATIALEYLSGGSWVLFRTFTRWPWTGANALGAAPAVASGYRAAVLADVPALYWQLEETVGTAAIDSSGNGRTGTYTTDASVLTTPGLLLGTSRAILLPGSSASDQMGVTINNEVFPTASAWTFTVVLRIDRFPVASGFCSIWQAVWAPDGGVSAPELATLDVGGGRFRVRVMASGVAQLFLSTDSYSYGTRLHLALCYLPGTVRLLVNGISQGSATHTYTQRPGTASVGFSVFAGSSIYYPVPGVIDDVAFYTKALSDVQIAAHVASMDVQPAVGQTFLPMLLHTQAPERARIAASAPVAAFSTREAASLQLARDIEHGGPGTIYGTTKTKGTPNLPTKARVVLQHQRSKLPVRETWSDPVTGYFEFRGIDINQQFLTLAEDVDGNFRPVAANRLTPEVLA